MAILGWCAHLRWLAAINCGHTTVKSGVGVTRTLARYGHSFQCYSLLVRPLFLHYAVVSALPRVAPGYPYITLPLTVVKVEAVAALVKAGN